MTRTIQILPPLNVTQNKFRVFLKEDDRIMQIIWIPRLTKDNIPELNAWLAGGNDASQK